MSEVSAECLELQTCSDDRGWLGRNSQSPESSKFRGSGETVRIEPLIGTKKWGLAAGICRVLDAAA
jgi:hypothetical protein